MLIAIRIFVSAFLLWCTLVFISANFHFPYPIKKYLDKVIEIIGHTLFIILIIGAYCAVWGTV